MGIQKYLSEISVVKDEIHKLTKDEPKPSLGEGLSGFWERAKFSIKLIFLEKELITFAILQWVCIIAGYYLWVQIIGWIPEEAWEKIGESSRNSVSTGDIIFFIWSFVCVGLVAFPLGLLSGAMGAVHFLNRQGKESTIPACIKMVLPRVWPLWIFHWIDGWYTVNRILDRIPSKRRRSAAQRALSEALYYAWKIATIGIMPGLVTGRGLIDSTKRSVGMVIKKFKDVIILRAGYSGLCWIVGIATYIGSIFFFMTFPELVGLKAEGMSGIYKFYFWAGVPMMVSVGVIMLFLRPIYIISACDIYADYVQEEGENLMLPKPQGSSRDKGYDSSAIIAIILLLLTVIAVIIFRHELGLMDMLANDW